MSFLASRRFTIGTTTVIEHGVWRDNTWVRTVSKRSPATYQYKVEVEDTIGSAAKGEVQLRTAGTLPPKIEFVPTDPASLPIRSFRARPEIVNIILRHSATNVRGFQDIDIDVTVEHPTHTLHGTGRNRVRVDS